MPCFIVQAVDGNDAEAPARRQSVRESHLQNLERRLNHVRMAVATLDDNGQANGSLLITEFPDRAALDAWLQTEPYVQHKVWHSITVTPGRLPPVFAGKTA